MPFGLCNATATFQRLMAQTLTGVTKKYGNLLMCYVDDVVIATPSLEDHIDRLDEVFGCMKRAGLKCKPSKCEILRDSIKYLGRMVDRHGVRPDPDAVEAVLTWKAPRTDTQLMSFLGFANYYREFIKGYADKVYPMQKLMRNKGKKFEWNNEAQVAFENIKRELCEAPVLGMPTEKGMYVLDTDASVVAISGILHQEQEWNGRTVLRPIAYGSKVLSDTEMKYGAPKAEMFAVVTFVEKYRAYLGSAPFKLRVDNRALSWLKTYSMDQSYIGRWIVRLDGYHMIIEHRMRDKHQNADSLSKKTEFYERLEQKQANQAEIKEGFSFLDKETYEALPLTRWLDKSGHPIPGHPELPVEKAAEIKILSKGDPIPLDLLLRSNLVQQELSRMNINSLSLLDKTVQVTPQVMRMLGGLLEREVTRDDPEWTAAVASLTVREKVKIMPSRRQHEENERDCRTIVQQLVSSIPQEILTSTSYGQKEQESCKQKKTVTFVDRDEEGEVVEQNLLQDYLSGEKDKEKDQRSQDQHPAQENLSGESEIDEKIPDEKQDLENKVLSGEFRWMRRRYRHDLEERTVSSTTPSTDDNSENSRMNTYSDRDSTSGSDLSELAIHTLLVETRARDLDREVYQDPDSDRYLIPSERVFDNAADDLETIAVSKRSISLLPQKEVVRTDLHPFKQETQPLAKIWCVKMEEDTHQPNEMNGQMRVMKTYLKARYRLSDLLRAQRNDRMTSNLKRWIENGKPDKGDLEEDSYRILRQYFMQKEGRLYLNKDGIVACKRREEDKVLYKYNAIVLPQLYQTELLFRSHDQMGHQGIDKVYQRILKRFEWPGMKKACEKWVTACLSCQQVKDPRKLRFPLQSIESSEFNEVVQIDQKAAGAKVYSVGDYVWVFQNVIPPKGTKKLLKKWRGPFMITEVHQEGRFYRLSTGRAAHYENIKPHNPSTEDWCIPADMEKGDYLMMDPACEVNEKGTREKNDGNEVIEEGTNTPLDLDPNEVIEAEDETLPYAEEDWQDPEQTEVPKNMDPDLPFTMQTRQGDGKRPRKKYNRYGDDYVVDKIDLKKIVEEVVGLESITVSQDIDIVDDHDQEWIEDRSKPEVDFDEEQSESNRDDLTNLRVLEWLNEMTSDPKETSVTIQDVDRESAKYIKTERDDPSWPAQEGQLLIPASNLDLISGMRSTGTPMDIFVWGVGVGLTHTENLIIKKLRIARETGNLEAETGEEPKKPDIGRLVESYFNLPNEYSNNIILTDSDFILTNRTCAIAITADMSFRTALASDFKREYKNVEFLWKQRPGIGGVAALPPAVSQIPGKYLCFLVTRATEKQHVDPENLVLSLTRLRDFLVEMDVKELSLPVYDPNRGRLHPRELYALVHVIFSDTNIQVYLHKKYYLSIG